MAINQDPNLTGRDPMMIDRDTNTIGTESGTLATGGTTYDNTTTSYDPGTDRDGGGSNFLAFLIGGLVIAIGLLAFLFYDGGSTTGRDVNTTSSTTPRLEAPATPSPAAPVTPASPARPANPQ